MSAHTHPVLNEIAARDGSSQGSISACAGSGCGWRCCQFMQGNYIVLHPDELEAARSRGDSLTHLHVFDEDYYGGARATCHAVDGSNCDNGYKPLDCATYPLFPKVMESVAHSDAAAIPTEASAEARTQSASLQWLRGAKCPLGASDLTAHLDLMRSVWQRVMELDPQVRDWLRHVTLVGYRRHSPS